MIRLVGRSVVVDQQRKLQTELIQSQLLESYAFRLRQFCLLKIIVYEECKIVGDNSTVEKDIVTSVQVRRDTSRARE